MNTTTQYLKLACTCEEVEGLRLLCTVRQVAVGQSVGFSAGAVVERRQRQVLNKQLLQRQDKRLKHTS